MLKHRSYQKELLDGDNIPPSDIYRNMQELNTVNTLLGGHKVTCKGIEKLVKTTSNQPLTIAEIGCGGGDNLYAVHTFLNRKKITHKLIGIDINKDCLDYAAKRYEPLNARWIESDYKSTSWPNSNKPDIIFSSLFCHHFTDCELITQLRWMKENSTTGFFINDLHRHPVAYCSIKVLTQLFSKSYLVKNDAPLSVKRGFKKREWIKLLQLAGITSYTINSEWAFRHLICAVND